MRFCIVGAGAIGGFVGAKLALAGEDVTYIARGKNLEAINAHGMHVFYRDGREETATSVKATDDYAKAGTFDVIIIALKAHQVGAVAEKLGPLYHENTVVIPMQNGIPFWYFHDHGGELAGRTVETVDPGGVVKNAIPKERLIGCVVYPATELTAPGKVVHIEGDRFPIGELNGVATERATQISEAFTKAGLKCPLLDNVRAEMWLKLWGNLTFNPISALTHATLQDICEDPYGKELAVADDEGGAGRRRAPRHHLPRAAGEAHRGRAQGGQAQDLDAAGRGGGPPHRDRCPRGIRGRAGRPDRDPGADHPRHLPGRQAPRHHLYLADAQHPRRPDGRKLIPIKQSAGRTGIILPRHPTIPFRGTS